MDFDLLLPGRRVDGSVVRVDTAEIYRYLFLFFFLLLSNRVPGSRFQGDIIKSPRNNPSIPFDIDAAVPIKSKKKKTI